MRLSWILPALVFVAPLHAQTPYEGVARTLRASPNPAAGYVRFNFPRRDLTVRLGDVTLNPAFALTTWRALPAIRWTAT